MDLAADLEAELFDVGVIAEQCLRHRRGELGLVGDIEGQVPQHAHDALDHLRRVVGRRCGRGQPTPVHLCDEVFLRGEIDVGGRAGQARLGRDERHRQLRVAHFAEYLDGGRTQFQHRVGTFARQSSTSGFNRGLIRHSWQRYPDRHGGHQPAPADHSAQGASGAGRSRSAPRRSL